MDVFSIKKEEPVDYELIDDGVQDIYTITIKEEPIADWSSSYDGTALKSESCGKNESFFEAENFEDNYHHQEDEPSDESYTGAETTQRPTPVKSKTNGKFSCNVCRAVFKRKSSFEYHMKVHESNSNSEFCRVCHKAFRKSIIKFHERFFHQGPPFQCPTCDKEFKDWTCFRQHRKVHRNVHREKTFECDICQKRFATKGNLDSHNETHAERERKFQCEFCGRRFLRNNTRLRHIRNMHSKPRTKSVCSICNRAYYRLNEHEKKCRQQKPSKKKIKRNWRQYSNKCDKCAKEFRDQFTLALHTQQNCTKRILYECALCARKMPKSNIGTHFSLYHQKDGQSLMVKKPNNLKAYECDCCRKIFRTEFMCNRHEHNCKLRREYTETDSIDNTERFACAICGRIFCQKYGIVEHMRIMHSTASLSGGKLETKTFCSMNREVMRSYPCCDQNYVGGELNAAHIATVNCKFRCRRCNNSIYADRYSLLRHCADHSTKVHQTLRHLEQCKRCDRVFQWKNSMPEYLQE